jgi:hypothetical protein
MELPGSTVKVSGTPDTAWPLLLTALAVTLTGGSPEFLTMTLSRLRVMEAIVEDDGFVGDGPGALPPQLEIRNPLAAAAATEASFVQEDIANTPLRQP